MSDFVSPFRQMEKLLGLDPIKTPEPIDVHVRLPTLRSGGEPIPAASPEDELARKAVAEIEREDGFHGCAESRLRGAYDGDAEHRIAMKAIELFKQSNREAGTAQQAPARNK